MGIITHRKWGADVWIAVLLFCCLMTFLGGLWLGRLTISNSIVAAQQQMDDTRQEIENCGNSVILVDSAFAQQIGYHAKGKHLVCTRGR